ncbi:MAG: SH3 domain-containing protein [Comamonadaceae bacterium]|nr:MAG: SH3 domain-containing protein [Comamonadaceae bacterium]
MIRIAPCLLFAAFLLPAAWAQEAALTRRAVELRDAPGDQARSLASLPAQSPVTRTSERRGPWVQVRIAGGATGWLHLFDVGPASAAPEGGGVAGSALRGVTSLFGNARPTTQTASTSGIRGLGAEDLAQAQPNAAGVSRMEAQRQGDADVRSFAQRAGWQPAAVEPLPAPAASPSSSAPSGGSPAQQVAP